MQCSFLCALVHEKAFSSPPADGGRLEIEDAGLVGEACPRKLESKEASGRLLLTLRSYQGALVDFGNPGSARSQYARLKSLISTPGLNPEILFPLPHGQYNTQPKALDDLTLPLCLEEDCPMFSEFHLSICLARKSRITSSQLLKLEIQSQQLPKHSYSLPDIDKRRRWEDTKPPYSITDPG